MDPRTCANPACGVTYRPDAAKQKVCRRDACKEYLAAKYLAKCRARVAESLGVDPIDVPVPCIVCGVIFKRCRNTQKVCTARPCRDWMKREKSRRHERKVKGQITSGPARPVPITPTVARDRTIVRLDTLPCLSCALATPCAESFSGVQCTRGLMLKGKALTGTCLFHVDAGPTIP